MRKFCNSLREHAKSIIGFEKKKMIPFTYEELKSYKYARVCYICRKYLLKRLAEDINHRKVGDRRRYTVKYIGTEHSICNLKFNVPNEIPVVFYRGSNYDYHFVIKDLANASEGQFECIREKKKNAKLFLFQ